MQGPSHYSRYNPQPVEVIEKWGLGFHLGNVLKYLVRAPYKQDELRDLRKAKWYLDRYLLLRETEIRGGVMSPPDKQA
jgi:hypothetical protein